MQACALLSCQLPANSRCSNCREVFYCSAIHQKQHWKEHKELCQRHSAHVNGKKMSDTPKNLVERSEATSTVTSATSMTAESEKRTCRCMFCGDALVLSSEEEAVDHMRVCPALQEQLASKDQFTVPKIIQEKMSNK